MRQGKSLYQRWTQKIDDKERHLSVPNKSLKRFFDSYLLSFIKQQKVHEKCHGGEVRWSPKTSLETHLPCENAFSFDISDAFRNTNFVKVFSYFYRRAELLGFHCEDCADVASILALLTTVRYNCDRGLSVGSPISMALFNRIMQPIDEKLDFKSKERGFRYSRWVDDFTISSQCYNGLEQFLGSVDIVSEEFPISKEKIFFQNSDKIYLLGHKIINGKILEKNIKDERLKNKNSPINFYEWFDNKTKNYDSWV